MEGLKLGWRSVMGEEGTKSDGQDGLCGGKGWGD